MTGQDARATGDGVSRRRFLQAVAAVGGTAAVGGVLWKVVLEDDGDDPATRRTVTPKLNVAGTHELRTFHLVLPAGAKRTGAWHIGNDAYQLQPHTSATLDALPGPLAGLLGDPKLLTHFVADVPIPVDVAYHQHTLDGVDDKTGFPVPGQTVYLGTKVIVPTSAIEGIARTGLKASRVVGAYASSAAVRDTVAAASVGAATIGEVSAAIKAAPGLPTPTLWGTEARWAALKAKAPSTVDEVLLLADVSVQAHDTALSMIMKHPQILRSKPEEAAAVQQVLDGSAPMLQLATVVDRVMNDDGPIGTFDAVDGVDNLAVGDGTTPVKDVNNAEVPPIPVSTLTIDPALVEVVGGAINDAVNLTMSDPRLLDITYQIRRTDTPDPVATTGLKELPTETLTLTGDCLGGSQSGLTVAAPADQQSTTVSFTVDNTYLRHVQVSMAFYTDDGKGVPVDEPKSVGAQLPYSADFYWDVVNYLTGGGASVQSRYLVPLGVLGSATTAFGIPVPGTETEPFSVTFPNGATQARLFLHGLGFGSFQADSIRTVVDDQGRPQFPDLADLPGSWVANVFTLFLDLVKPAVMLMTQANTLTNAKAINKPVEELLTSGAKEGFQMVAATMNEVEKLLGKGLALAFATLAGTTTVAVVGQERNDSGIFGVMENLGVSLLKLGAQTFAQKLWERIVAAQVAADAARAIPFLGEAFTLINAAASAVQVAVTTIDLSSASKVHSTVMIPTYTANVTFTHDDGTTDGDPGDATLPDQAATYILQYHVNGHPSPKSFTGPVDRVANGPASQQTVTVPNVPMGGTITWEVTLFTKEGWQVGHGASAAIPNGKAQQGTATAKPTFAIIESLVPITDQSKLEREASTAVTNGVGGLTDPTAAVPGRAVDLAKGNDPGALHELDGITVATRLGRLGYVWSSGGKFWARNLSVVNDKPGWQLSRGFTSRPHLVYDGMTADLEGARDLLLEPIVGKAGYLVRQIQVGAGPDLTLAKGSLGFLPGVATDVAFHPKGYLVAVSAGGRIQIVKLADGLLDDELAPGPVLAAGPGTREGRLHIPTKVTVTPKGTIVVLDTMPDRTNELRAFALDGQPTPIFKDPNGGADKVSIVPVDTRTYLSLSTDGAGFLYLLSSGTDDQDEAGWRLDVIGADGTKLVSFPHVNAGALTVDFWRRVYTLDYRPILTGTPPFAPDQPAFRNSAQVVEPTASVWKITTPKPA